MIKQFAYGLAFTSMLGLGLTSCQNGTQDKADNQDKKEEVEHNPASQTIPEESKDLLGRWDLNVDKNGTQVPSWIEIKLSGFTTLVGYWVGDSGSSRPISHIKLQDGKFSFAIPPQWEGGHGDITIEGELAGAEIKGTITNNNGEKYTFTGTKAPYLNRTAEPTWGKPIELFNGKDLTGWKPSNDKNKWVVKDGILTNEDAGANLITEKSFEDFKLNLEFKYPEGSNSGVYLRGRYEVQIEDSPKDRHPGNLYFGAIYGFLTPNAMVTNGPNEWNNMEITLVGRLVSVAINGKTVIDKQEIPGITGGALDSKEGEPGPLYIQGDHGPIEFRKITITEGVK
ncbi:3-keto-disaccharide hydrolase [Sphingobacterium sp. NPDC055346]